MALQRSGQSAAKMFAVRAPITSRDDRLVDTERFHQGDDIDRDRRLLAVPRRVAREEARGAIAAQMGHDHAIAGIRE
jgi:hypothetical protein